MAEEALVPLLATDMHILVGDALARAAAIHFAAGNPERGRVLLLKALERYRANAATALVAQVEKRITEMSP